MLTGPPFYKLQLPANTRLHIVIHSAKTYTAHPEVIHSDDRRYPQRAASSGPGSVKLYLFFVWRCVCEMSHGSQQHMVVGRLTPGFNAAGPLQF